MNIIVNADSRTPIYKQVYQQIREMIVRGNLAEGSKLPSERGLAQKLGVHRNTIIRVYNDLKADGYIDSRRGAGCFVSFADSPPPPLQVGRLPKGIYWPAIIKNIPRGPGMRDGGLRGAFAQAGREHVISFAGGAISPEVYSAYITEHVIAEIVSKGDSYVKAPIQGRNDLRSALSKFLKGKGIRANASEILVLSNTHQALDYAIELLLEPGDTIIMEEPCYPNINRQFSIRGINVVTVPVDENGMMAECVEPFIFKFKPKLLYINSSYNDPTTAIMNTERRKILLALSYKHNIPIYEDDWASELCYADAGIPSVKALDPGSNVIYTYSFHLTYAPGISLALITGTREFITGMTNLMSMKFVNVDNMSQSMLSFVIEKGFYRESLKGSCLFYKEKRDLMCERLERAKPLGLSFLPPAGGISVWCRLPDRIDMQKLLGISKKRGVIFTPGNLFFAGGPGGGQFMQLNFCYPDKEQIEMGLDTLIGSIASCLC